MTDLTQVNLTPKNLEEALETIGHLATIIIELKEEITQLKEENASLKEQLNTNSKNSSLPPSRDLKKKKQSKPKSGRPRGGQSGHKGHQRALVPIEKVTSVVVCPPPSRCDCGKELDILGQFERHQVFELPTPSYEVIEYQRQTGCCKSCRRRYQGSLPPGVSRKGFGARAQAMVSLLTSKYRLSKRLVHTWFSDVYHMPICLGSVSNIEHTVSQSLEQTHKEIKAQIQSSKAIHLDETGHKECNQNGWAWIMSTQDATYFKLERSLGRKIAKELIGDFRDHIYVTDRYSAYDFLPDRNRQVCWAHLKRDFQKISERPGVPGKIGKKLLKAYERLFKFWKTEYDPNILSFKKPRKRFRYFKARLLRHLRECSRCTHKATARTCTNILESVDSLWNFFEIPNVPPTNNHAERQLRPLVISKKLTFGTQSERGSRFIERIFSIVATCKQQQKDVLVFIMDALQRWVSIHQKLNAPLQGA
ncbi:IS66 family transposase [Legionella pneumophila serogroup 1]|nr:IS66 family transposase [Legionella pneumophila]HAU0697242.1 IS66 family transposase [Legionella pneumophila]HAU0874291.1 IS66 family transposase [Legionella pneumophila]HCE5346422.1 IS66 family transposase [Legionella pneumophila]HCE5355678.1 IS66 family transposase [Legionella pneumophila]